MAISNDSEETVNNGTEKHMTLPPAASFLDRGSKMSSLTPSTADPDSDLILPSCSAVVLAAGGGGGGVSRPSRETRRLGGGSTSVCMEIIKSGCEFLHNHTHTIHARTCMYACV